MASAAPVNSTTNSANKQIPLFCTVCPNTPHFSDVSHLLTHIASKGHLHHEVQTRLRSHQDLAAAVALQQYDQWYQQNGIETLLVERLRAKQVKEAARNKRNRALSNAAASVSYLAISLKLQLTFHDRRTKNPSGAQAIVQSSSSNMSN